MRPVSSSRLERWLGAETVERVSASARGWYGPPIALAGVPGKVYACGDGDFCGSIRDGFFASAYDRFADLMSRLRRGAQRTVHSARHGKLNAGFASLSDLISEATTAGKARYFLFNKAGTSGAANGSSNTLWYVGSAPAAGANGGAAPGGTAMSSATTGAFPFTNPTGGDTLHFVCGEPASSIANCTLLLYDRLFSVTKTMNSTGTEAVSGVPTRYQSTTGGNADSAEGNFLTIEVRTVLANTAHNWTVCTYTDQSGNTGATLPTVTGVAQAAVNRLDMPNTHWFCPLASGDTGIKNLTQMQCSAAVATGAIDFTIGHAIALMPCPVAFLTCTKDGVSTAFNLVRIFDNACLAFLEVNKATTGATTYSGSFAAVAG